MNKSFCTTFISFLIFAISFLIPHEFVKTLLYQAGLFALSGAITNWLAVYMLFERIPFLYGSGVIPARFDEFKKGIHHLVMNTFFTKENMNRFLKEETLKLEKVPLGDLIQNFDLDPIFDGLVQMVMDSKIGGMLGMFGGASAIEPLRESFKKVIREKLLEFIENPETMEKVQQKLNKHVPQSAEEILIPHIAQLVEFRLEELTPEMVKKIVADMIQKHLGWLVVWGGVFGGLIGVLSTLLQHYQLI